MTAKTRGTARGVMGVGRPHPVEHDSQLASHRQAVQTDDDCGVRPDLLLRREVDPLCRLPYLPKFDGKQRSRDARPPRIGKLLHVRRRQREHRGELVEEEVQSDQACELGDLGVREASPSQHLEIDLGCEGGGP